MLKTTQFDEYAFYIPRRLYDGDELFNDIVIFLSDNKDTISNISNNANTVTDAIGKIRTNNIDIVTAIKN